MWTFLLYVAAASIFDTTTSCSMSLKYVVGGTTNSERTPSTQLILFTSKGIFLLHPSADPYSYTHVNFTCVCERQRRKWESAILFHRTSIVRWREIQCARLPSLRRLLPNFFFSSFFCQCVVRFYITSVVGAFFLCAMRCGAHVNPTKAKRKNELNFCNGFGLFFSSFSFSCVSAYFFFSWRKLSVLVLANAHARARAKLRCIIFLFRFTIPFACFLNFCVTKTGNGIITIMTEMAANEVNYKTRISHVPWTGPIIRNSAFHSSAHRIARVKWHFMHILLFIRRTNEFDCVESIHYIMCHSKIISWRCRIHIWNGDFCAFQRTKFSGYARI